MNGTADIAERRRAAAVAQAEAEVRAVCGRLRSALATYAESDGDHWSNGRSRRMNAMTVLQTAVQQELQ